jgi:hypothetical protein
MIARSLLLGSALAACVALATPASALDDDGRGGIFDGIAGLVGLDSDKAQPDIEYRERAPLVLPKQRTQLPPPAQRRERSAAWPQDPDALAAQQQAARARAPKGLGGDKDGLRMSKQELLAGRAAGAPNGPKTDPGCQGSRGSDCMWLNPEVMKSQDRNWKDETVAGVGTEPDRKWLTQPPRGYRKVTQQTGGGKVAPARDLNEASPWYAILNPFGKKDEE